MVSFSCSKCGDVVKKPKVVSHAGQCGTGSYSCVDCMQVFDLNTIQKHTSCISEVQKYQGKWVPDFKKKISADSDSDSEETKRKAHTMQRPSRPMLSFSDSDDSDDEKPAAKKAPAPKKSPVKAPKKSTKDSDSDSEDEKPTAKKVVEAKKPVTLAPKRVRDSDSDSDDDKPKKAVKPRTASPALNAKKRTPSPAKKAMTAPSSSKMESLELPSTTKPSASRIASDKQYSISGEPIALGTHELIGEIVDEIIAEQRALNNNANPSAATIGQELVLRYRKRLGKAMAKAIAPILEERGI